METPHVMRRTQAWYLRHLGWAVLIAAAMVPGPAGAAYPGSYSYLCSSSGWDVPEDCCTNNATKPAFASHCTTNNGGTDRRNILLVIADDHDYCLYGFMAGICSKNTSLDCTSERQCGTNDGKCVGSRDLKTCVGGSNNGQLCDGNTNCGGGGTCTGGAPSNAPLRLNDLACRNRQPYSPDGNTHCTETGDDGGLDLEENLRFNRGEAPCAGTDAEARPALHTPHLDTLATKAAVFPRAYVAGTTCKNSRRTMMVGRYMRHMQYLWNGGSGKLEDHSVPKGCTAEGTGGCEPVHTLGWWPQHGHGKPPTTPTDNSYKAFTFAKTEWVGGGQGGFDADDSNKGKSQGKVRCGSDTNCQTALTQGGSNAMPTAVMFDDKKTSLHHVTDAIDSTVDTVGSGSTSSFRQTHPFVIWFGPHMPHDNVDAEPFLSDNEFYDDDVVADHEREHYGRVTWLDAVFGGLVHHLKRACTCAPGSTAQAKSLWSNTVVLFLADQGYLLPGAKQNAREQTQRTPLIVSSPEHRDGTEDARVFDNGLAGAIDLLPTIMAYAGQKYFSGEEFQDDYPHGRNLKPLIEDGTWPTDGSVTQRNLHLAQEGKSGVKGDTGGDGAFPRDLVTRPGFFGVCTNPYNFTDPGTACASGDKCHVHPCLSNDDCDLPDGDLGACICPTSGSPCSGSSGMWQRCVNRPDVRCDSDDDCAVQDASRGYDALCTSSTCVDVPEGGSFKDFVGEPCTGPAGCVPPRVCRPLMLRVADHSLGAQLTAAWDPEFEPDWAPDYLHPGTSTAQVNLLKVSPTEDTEYLKGGATSRLFEEFKGCFKALQELDSNDAWHDNTSFCGRLADWR